MKIVYSFMAPRQSKQYSIDPFESRRRGLQRKSPAPTGCRQIAASARVCLTCTTSIQLDRILSRSHERA